MDPNPGVRHGSAAERRYRIVGLGELLWDMLPSGKQLGGAPANFAYISTLLGNEGIVASRVGSDALGREALGQLGRLGLTTRFIQTDPVHPTGTVRVELDNTGQPKFAIAEPAAWDFLESTADWRELAAQADAICFGSLAQRASQSRATICRFLETTRKDAVRVFDVNLRQHFYTADVVAESLKYADILKLNHEELPWIAQLLGIPCRDERAAARALMALGDIRFVCVTRGGHGSLLVNDQTADEHPGYQVRVADTIGAGDGFTAALVRESLRKSSLKVMNALANRVGAWVASQTGAMPQPGNDGFESDLAQIA